MTRPTVPQALTLLLGLSLALPALAQETAAPAGEAPAGTGDLSLGTPAAPAPDGPGSLYVASEHGDWQVRCVRTEDGSDPCQLYQLLREEAGNSVAEISLFPLPEGQQAVAGATIVVPLETLLPEQLRLQVDGAEARLYPFTWCAPEGCVARVGLTEGEVDAFKRGRSASVRVVPVVAPDQEVVAQISLMGFTAAYEALLAAEAANAAPPADGAAD